MNSFFLFFAAINNAYNNKLRFFYYKKFQKLDSILLIFMQKGLLLGFIYIHEKVIIHLKYINDTPFFRIISITKPSRRLFFSKKSYIRGRLSGSETFILNSQKKGLFYSNNIIEKFFDLNGGEVFIKILFFNENNLSKKNSFI